jgi:hypothetical protein
MEMIVMGEDICSEGRYRKAFVNVWVLCGWTPIHIFFIDEDCIREVFTCQISVIFWASL